MVERKVDMVRLPRNDEFYDREDIFGRDVSSVFPKQAEAASTSTGATADAFKEALGARKFISETELEAIKSSRGTRADDGSETVLKPLVEVLREAKEKKEADFQGKWKQMKQGKNRPLEPDELEFFDKLLQDQDEKERAQRLHERAELEEYRKALQEAKESEFTEPGATPVSDPQPRPKVDLKPAPKASVKPPVIKAAIKVKPKAAAPDAAQGSGPPLKKAKVDEAEGEGLAGLLGGYDSDSQ